MNTLTPMQIKEIERREYAAMPGRAHPLPKGWYEGSAQRLASADFGAVVDLPKDFTLKVARRKVRS